MKKIKVGSMKFALVDDEDFEALDKIKWYCSIAGYAKRNKKKGDPQSILMHRFILGITQRNLYVDHIDRNPLNNQRSNLRICTKAENQRNCIFKPSKTSKFKGVYRHRNKWAAVIRATKKYHIGLFEDEHEAARHYNLAAKHLHKEFANFNAVTPMFPTQKVTSRFFALLP